MLTPSGLQAPLHLYKCKWPVEDDGKRKKKKDKKVKKLFLYLSGSLLLPDKKKNRTQN